MSTGVPEFKSFPPTFSSFPDLDDEPGPSTKKKDRNLTKSSSKHDGKRRSDKDCHSKHSEKDRHSRSKDDRKKKHRDDRKLMEAEDFIEEALRDRKLTSSESTSGSKGLYVEDRRGDENNLRYGNTYDGPKFKRLGYGEVLGFPSGWKLNGSGKNEVALRGKPQNTRYLSSRGRIDPTTVRKIIPPKQTALLEDFHSEFIAIPSSRRKSPGLDPDYRSVEVASDRSSAPSESEVQSDDSDDEFTAPVNLVSQTNARLTAAVKAEPTSIPAWFELVDHSVSGAATAQARSDIALTILEKTFHAHWSNKSNAALRARWLLAGSPIWPAERLAEEWETALRLTPRAPFSERADLWTEYLTYRLKLDGVSGLEEAVKRIWDVVEKEPPSEELDQFKLRVMWRCCVGLSELGYTERATAIFQAQLELSLFTPENLLDFDLPTKLDVLEEFWESECPRVGEAGATGWSAFITGSTAQPPGHQVGAPEATGSPPGDGYERWHRKESYLDRTGLLPKRSTDEDEDPYSTILFTDIRPFLFNPPSPSSSAFQTLLVYVFLHFLGLHIPGLTSHVGGSHDSNWAHTRFRSSPATLFPFSAKKDEAGWEVVHGTVVAKEAQIASAWGPVKEWTWGILSPLEGFGVRGEGRMWEPEDLKALGNGVELARRLFQQLSPVLKSAEFDQQWLAFEAASSLKQALKVSRNILSQHRDSIPRWAAHARLERIRGKVADARKVYEASLQGQSISSERSGVVKMFWDWAEMEWLANQPETAKTVIAQASGQADTFPTSLLRAQKVLEAAIQEAQTTLHRQGSSSADILVPLVNLAALLDLLVGTNASKVVARYTMHLDPPPNSISPLDPRTIHRLDGSLALSSALLLYHHTRTLRSSVPPSILRNLAETSVQRFPHNTILLGVWLESERGESVWGRVREMLTKTILRPGVDISRVLWGVWQEGRDNINWEVERARSTLARTIDDDRTRMSPSAWLVAIALEIGMGQSKRAKSLAYRALADCPWSKALYMLPFAPPLRREFSRAEMEQWANTMAERGIRLREGLESYVEDVLMEDADSSDEGGDRELEDMVGERRRLAPY